MPNIKMNPPQVYMCSPFWTLLPPPSPYHPSGSSQCTSPKHPVFSKAFVIVVYSLSCVLLFCEPMDCKPPGSSVCGILQAKNTRVGCHFFLQGIFPIQGSDSCIAGKLFTTEPPRKPFNDIQINIISEISGYRTVY